MIGAFVFALPAFSFVRTGVVKNEEVRPAHFIGVEVYLGLFETFLEVGECDEEFAIIRDR